MAEKLDKGIEIRTVAGREIAGWVGGLAQLRIHVFREFPYLYDGDADYEARYLEGYVRSERAVVVLALDRGELVGASTGLPMVEADQEFRQPFLDAGIDIADVFYCGESVLLPEFRGRGIYRHFFHGREAHALGIPGIGRAAFCAVRRDRDHPLRPPGYEPLDAIWRRFGYELLPGVVGTFGWKDIDRDGETFKEMQFYFKDLRGSGRPASELS